MGRKLWVIAAIAVGLLVASSMAYAADRVIVKPNAPKARLGQLYDRSTILRFDDGPVLLPRPVGSPAALGSTASSTTSTDSSVPGPVAASFDSPKLGGAMAQPRSGGSIYSGQEQADREIKQLIRRLN